MPSPHSTTGNARQLDRILSLRFRSMSHDCHTASSPLQSLLKSRSRPSQFASLKNSSQPSSPRELADMEQDPRRAVRRPQCAQDWEDQKAAILELRMRMELVDFMRVMEEDYLFKATYVLSSPSQRLSMLRPQEQRESVKETISKMEIATQAHQR